MIFCLTKKRTLLTLFKHILTLVSCFLLINNIFAHSLLLGTPTIHQHNKQKYQAGSHNWDVKHHKNHVFFTNNEGLLSYDGVKWKPHTTPNKTIMRSLCIRPSGRIYIGAQNEIGYFETSPNGELFYVDLKDSLSLNQADLSEIWDIEVSTGIVYFSSGQRIYTYQKGKTHHFDHAGNISAMARVNKQIWYQVEGEGVYYIQEGKKVAVKWGAETYGVNNVITFIEGFDQRVYILSRKKGIFVYDEKQQQIIKWQTNADRFLEENQISSAVFHPQYGLLVGTYLGGLLQLNTEGLVTALYNKKNGLQNNTINCVSVAPDGTIWTGSNNGIDEIDLAKSHFRFYPDNDLEGAVYDVDRWNGFLFFSTSNGLYYLQEKTYYNPLEANNFQLVAGTKGQTWGTDLIDGQLYCAHHEGPMQIQKDLTATPISTEKGAWKFVPLSSSMVALGHYHGLSLYEKQANGQLQFYRKVQDFEESARIMILDQFDNLWISHPYKNVYKINFTADYSQETIGVYTKDNGFQNDNRNYVFNINNHCYLTNETGVYQYDQQEDRFEKEQIISANFKPGNHLRRLIQNQEDIWCISDDFTLRLRFEKTGIDHEIKGFQLKNLPTQETYIGGFEELFPLSDEQLIISTEAGAIHYNYADNNESPFEVSIKSIHLPQNNDSVLYGGFGQVPPIQLEAQQNHLRFTYSSLTPSSGEALQYSTRIESLNSNWSAWQNSHFKNYTNLPHGKHTFEVKAMASDGTESKIMTIPFSIATPWYRSITAYFIYTLIFIGLLATMFGMLQSKYLKNTKKLEQAKLEQEKELEHIKKEKLLNEIEFKNQELATSTLHLLQKNQTIETLKTKFDELNQHIKNPELKKELNKILHVFREDLRQEEDREKFTQLFDQAHHDFITKLKAKHPSLTSNDHKVCALLKMNLSTKEMAPLLNISVRGVEISRYRLRKKLEVDRSVNLNSYFNSEYFT